MANQIPQVVPALAQAGLPVTSIEQFVAALSTGAYGTVPGVTPAIINTGVAAYKEALVSAFRLVFYTALALLLTNCILTIFFPNLDHKMKLGVAAKLHRPGAQSDRSPDTSAVDATREKYHEQLRG